MESWLVVFDRRNEIGALDRYDQVCVGCVGVQAIGDKSGIFQCHLIAMKELARTGNFSSFADSRGGDGDRHALLDIKEGHNRTKIFANALPSKASVLGNCPRCWPSQALSA